MQFGDFIKRGDNNGFVNSIGPDGIAIVIHGVVLVSIGPALQSLRYGWKVVSTSDDGTLWTMRKDYTK